jgi:hypothetical protein
MPFKHLDDIEIVGHAPMHVVSGDIGGEVWRVNEKNHSRAIFVLTDEFLVITGSDFKTMKILKFPTCKQFVPKALKTRGKKKECPKVFVSL